MYEITYTLISTKNAHQRVFDSLYLRHTMLLHQLHQRNMEGFPKQSPRPTSLACCWPYPWTWRQTSVKIFITGLAGVTVERLGDITSNWAILVAKPRSENVTFFSKGFWGKNLPNVKRIFSKDTGLLRWKLSWGNWVDWVELVLQTEKQVQNDSLRPD